MIPTVPWMREKFAIYNNKYFGGRLPTPEFAVESLNKEWGKYDLNAQFYKKTREIFRVVNGNGRLVLTNSYSRPEKSVIASLLHEMIHEYVYLILRVYPENPHGPEFMSMADKINKDGWGVEEITFITDDDKTPEEIQNSVVLIISKPSGTDYRYWLCRVNPSQITAFESTVSKISGIKYGFYEIHSDCLNDAISDPIYLTGWRGMSFSEIVKQICDYYGVSEDVFSNLSQYRPRV